MLANMAAFFSEQHSLDGKDGMKKRVETELLITTAPYGYRSIESDKRHLFAVAP